MSTLVRATPFRCSASKYALIFVSHPVTGTPPTFAPLPSPVYTTVGSRLLLNCSASGTPSPTVTWYRGTTQLSSNGILDISNVTDNLDSSSGGVLYQCRATNTFGTIVSKPVSVFTASKYFLCKESFVSLNTPPLYPSSVR